MVHYEHRRKISMLPENLPPVTRMIVRQVAYGLNDSDICVNLPEFKPHQIAVMRQGATFKRALKEMQAQIDVELIEKAAEDPIRAYLHGKGMMAAKRLASLASGEDDCPHAVQAKCADSILAKAGYGTQKDELAIPVLMLSPDKLASIIDPKKLTLAEVPDCVDGHNGGLDAIK
jgi:hypothetical protein